MNASTIGMMSPRARVARSRNRRSGAKIVKVAVGRHGCITQARPNVGSSHADDCPAGLSSFPSASRGAAAAGKRNRSISAAVQYDRNTSAHRVFGSKARCWVNIINNQQAGFGVFVRRAPQGWISRPPLSAQPLQPHHTVPDISHPRAHLAEHPRLPFCKQPANQLRAPRHSSPPARRCLCAERQSSTRTSSSALL